MRATATHPEGRVQRRLHVLALKKEPETERERMRERFEEKKKSENKLLPVFNSSFFLVLFCLFFAHIKKRNSSLGRFYIHSKALGR